MVEIVSVKETDRGESVYSRAATLRKAKIPRNVVNTVIYSMLTHTWYARLLSDLRDEDGRGILGGSRSGTSPAESPGEERQCQALPRLVNPGGTAFHRTRCDVWPLGSSIYDDIPQ